MNPEFCIPTKAESLEAEFVHDVIDVPELTDDEVCVLLDNIDSELTSPGPLVIAKRTPTDQVFDQLYSLASKHFKLLSAQNRGKLLDVLTGGLASLLKVIPAFAASAAADEAGPLLALQRAALKMFVWLLHRVVLLARERPGEGEGEGDRLVVGKRGGRRKRKERAEGFDSFEGQRERLLRLLIHSLDAPHLWDLGHPEEAFLRVLSQTGLALLENPDNVTVTPVREGIVSLLAATAQQHLAAAQHGVPRRCSLGPGASAPQRRRSLNGSDMEVDAEDEAAQATSTGDSAPGPAQHPDAGGAKSGLEALGDLVINPLVELLIKSEHVGPAVTDLLLRTHADPAQRGFGPLFMQHVFLQTTTQFDAGDSVGARNISQLLIDVSEQRPALVHENMSAIHGNLDCESYAIRNAVVHAVGQVVAQLLSRDKAPAVVKARDQFLDLLQERVRDVNSFCRAKALGVWRDLWQQHSVPLVVQPSVLRLAMGRLRDKTCVVRRAALQLLTTTLEYNPFGQALVLATFEEKLKVAAADLQRLEASEADQPAAEATEYGLGELAEPRQAEASPQLRLKYRLQFFRSGAAFVQQMHAALGLATQLLFSKTTTDVLEAIRFVEAAYKFRLEPSQAAANRMAVLVFSIEPKVRETVLAAFQGMLSAWDTATGPEPAVFVHRLLKLVATAQEGELASLEEIVSQLTQKAVVALPVVDALWSLIAGQGARPAESRTAMRIFAMVAQSQPEQVARRLPWLEEVGLPLQSKRDYLFGVNACVALQKLAGTGTKFPASHPIIKQLASLITRKTSNLSLWMPLAEAALNTIYAVCSDPEVVCHALLNKLAERYDTVKHLLRTRNEAVEAEGDAEMDDAGNAGAAPAPAAALSPAEEHEARAHLMRLIFVVGHSALKQLVFYEEAYRRAAANTPVPKKPKPGGVDPNEVEGVEDEEDQDGEEDGIQEQLGLQSHVVADVEAERELRAKEQAMAAASSPWCRHFPLIIQVCLNPHDDPLLRHPVLRSCASLSLCKLMLLTGSTCSPAHLQVLFTVLKSAPEWHIRCNMVICIGDLLCRFPNATTPWVPEFFGRFHDSHPAVRSTALNVSRHLILNDMLKGTRHLHHLARALQDEDRKIAEMARLFFRELDLKSKHHIYNAFPDVFSELTADPAVPEDKAQRILGFLLSFVDTAGHAESLIEKLCQRMPREAPDAAALSVARQVAFCLTQLAVATDKGLRRLDSCFPLYARMLYDDVVHQHLVGLVLKLKRGAKDAQKLAVEELEARLNEQHAKGAERREMEAAMQQHIEERGRGRRKGRGDSDSEDDFVPAPPKPAATTAAPAGRRGRPSRVTAVADDAVKAEPNPGDDEESEEEPVRRTLRPRKEAPARWGLREEEEEEEEEGDGKDEEDSDEDSEEGGEGEDESADEEGEEDAEGVAETQAGDGENGAAEGEAGQEEAEETAAEDSDADADGTDSPGEGNEDPDEEQEAGEAEDEEYVFSDRQRPRNPGKGTRQSRAAATAHASSKRRGVLHNVTNTEARGQRDRPKRGASSQPAPDQSKKRKEAP